MNKGLTKRISGPSKTVWFCGCPYSTDVSGQPYEFDDHTSSHEIIFNSNKVEKVFICHTNQKFKRLKYEEGVNN